MASSHLVRLLPFSLVALAALVPGCDGPSLRNGGDVYGGEGSVIKTKGDAAVAEGAGGTFADAGGSSDGGAGVSAARSEIIAACEACEKSACSLTSPSVSDDYGSATSGEDFYAICFATTGNATQGPAKGTPLAALCKAVLDCAHATGCAVSADGLATSNGRSKNLDCYCGADVSASECMVPGKANGPCKAAIENAAGTIDPAKITANYGNPYFPSDDTLAPMAVNPAGAALGLIYFCEADQATPPPSPCTQTCLQPSATSDGGAAREAGPPDGDATGGQAGASGSGGGGHAGGGGPGCGPSVTGAPAAVTCGGSADTTCESCELAADPSVVPSCDPAYLTADPTRVDGTGSSWGFGTLPTAAQQTAARALFSGIVGAIKPGAPTGCATSSTNSGPGDSPQLGCLGGLGTSPMAILGGTLNGPLAALYKAAAVADGLIAASTGSPLTAGSSDHDFASAIAGVTSKPTSAIGLADNLFRCAFYLDQDPATACLLFDPGAGRLTGACTGAIGFSACDATDGGGDAAVDTSALCTGAAGAGGAGGSGGSAGVGDAAGTGDRPDGSAGSAAAGAAGSTAGSGGAACPDLDGDGVPDCQQTLVLNAGFGQAISAWPAEAGSMASWTSVDANGSTVSGAIDVTNVDTNPAHASNGWIAAGASQCLTVVPGSSYEIAAQLPSFDRARDRAGRDSSSRTTSPLGAPAHRGRCRSCRRR